MRKPKQQLLGKEFEVEKEFGGAHLKKSHAKKARPIPTKKSMHLTLRSQVQRARNPFDGMKIASKKLNLW